MERDVARLISFTDGAVAVAITALALPLLDVRVAPQSTLGDIASAYGGDLVAFLISFFIIAIYWVVHHRAWGSVHTVKPILLWVNFLWILGIVLMPVGSVLLYEDGAPTPAAFTIYAGLQGFTTFWLAAFVSLISSRRDIGSGGDPQPFWWMLRLPAWWMLVALVTVIDPHLGVLLLELSGVAVVVLGFMPRPDRWRRRSA